MLFEILKEWAAKRISDFQTSQQLAVLKYRNNPTNAQTRQTPFKTLHALAAFQSIHDAGSIGNHFTRLIRLVNPQIGFPGQNMKMELTDTEILFQLLK